VPCQDKAIARRLADSHRPNDHPKKKDNFKRKEFISPSLPVNQGKVLTGTPGALELTLLFVAFSFATNENFNSKL
jgi:hypothetical protein